MMFYLEVLKFCHHSSGVSSVSVSVAQGVRTEWGWTTGGFFRALAVNFCWYFPKVEEVVLLGLRWVLTLRSMAAMLI
jgi:hypothetical protein